MVADSLVNASHYLALGDNIAAGLKYLMETDFQKMEPGRCELEGERLYVMVQNNRCEPIAFGAWEAHRKYIDIQYIVSGIEYIGYANIQHLTETMKYDESNDTSILCGDGSFVALPEGSFMILWPNDAHMSCRTIGKPELVKKVVVKALI